MPMTQTTLQITDMPKQDKIKGVIVFIVLVYTPFTTTLLALENATIDIPPYLSVTTTPGQAVAVETESFHTTEE